MAKEAYRKTLKGMSDAKKAKFYRIYKSLKPMYKSTKKLRSKHFPSGGFEKKYDASVRKKKKGAKGGKKRGKKRSKSFF